jgi:hypothetical protein
MILGVKTFFVRGTGQRMRPGTWTAFKKDLVRLGRLSYLCVSEVYIWRLLVNCSTFLSRVLVDEGETRSHGGLEGLVVRALISRV